MYVCIYVCMHLFVIIRMYLFIYIYKYPEPVCPFFFELQPSKPRPFPIKNNRGHFGFRVSMELVNLVCELHQLGCNRYNRDSHPMLNM